MKASLVLLLLAALVFVVRSEGYICTPYDPYTRDTACSGTDYAPIGGLFLGTCHIENLPPTLDSTLQTLFPEGQHPDPALVRSDIFAVFTKDGSNISFTHTKSQGAYSSNRMGFAIFHRSNNSITEPTMVFPKVNTNSGCLFVGDTYKFGPFKAGTMMIFFLEPNSGGTRYWSYIDGSINPPYRNPDTKVCPPDGCVHSAWAYLTNEDLTVFGFEQASLGDADYNDFMFFLSIEGEGVFNEIPGYDGGTVLVCNSDTQISSSSPSYAEVNCTQWALLESTTSQSCLTYMSIPDGWIWAPYDDPRTLPIVSALSSKWSYTNAVCFLFSKNATSGAGYHPDGSPCLESEYEIKTFGSGSKLCYNARCTSRFVLLGADLSATCSSTSRCDAATSGAILGFSPTSSQGVTLFPSQYSVYLKESTGTVSVSTSLQLPGPASTTALHIDVMVLADFSTVPLAKISSVINSWSLFYNTFANNKLNATVGFAQFIPTNTAPYYTVTSTYSLSTSPAALTSTQFPSSPAACPSSGQRALQAAMKDVMNNAAINWRKDIAFKVLLVASACDFDYTTDLRSVGIATGIVPVYLFPSRGSFPSTWSSAPAANTVPLQGMYQTGSTTLWDSPFLSSTSIPIRGAAYLQSFPPQLFGVAASGSTSFVANLPTASTSADSTGFATLNYAITWPSSVAYDNSVPSYSTVVRIMGREKTSFNINFNHSPVLNDLSYAISGAQNQTIHFTPSDADGNIINLVVTQMPTKGTLYLNNGVMQLQKDVPLAEGVYSFLYVPNPYVSGQDNFLVTAHDGCATAQATVTLAITYANTPPVAQDFTIYMDEDQAAAGDIDFSPHISDVDIAAGQSQTLTVRLISLTSPASHGSLTTPNGASVSVGAISGYQLKYALTTPLSGYGTITFSYQVSDGTSQGNSASNIATVTVIIRHVNHAPVLSINPTTFNVKENDPAVSISGTITDYDNDRVNLYAVAHNLTTYEISTNDALLDSSKVVSLVTPFQFYLENVSVTDSVYSIASLKWSGTSGSDYQQVTFMAQDAYGEWSEPVTVTFLTIPYFPPRWTERPASTASILQGTTLSSLSYAATDDDPGDYTGLKFRLAVPPSNGIVRMKPISSGSDLTVSASIDYSNTVHSFYVGTNESPSPGISYFTLEYVPGASFYGTDTFTFNVRDSLNFYSTEVATVTVTVSRRDTPPISADSSIYASEAAQASTQIPVSSTNAPSNDVYLQLLTVDFDGTIYLDQETIWAIGANSSAINSAINNGLLTISATGNFGVFSDEGVPTGTFTYRAYEPSSGLWSETYTGSIYVAHVNHAPESRNQNDVVKRRDLLQVRLHAFDPDADDQPPTNVKAYFQSIAISSKGKFYFDSAMTNEISSETFSTPLTDRTFYYISNDSYSQPQTSPLASYTFNVVDSHGLSSGTYRGTVTVLYAGLAPVFTGNLEVTTYQETPVPMVLGVGVETETGADPVVTITSKPERGTLTACNDNGDCDEVNTLPFVVQSSTGRVIFLPRENDWDINFTTFNFNLTDPLSGATAAFTMTIHVIHVNKRPNIAAANFLTTAESTQVIVVNESSWRSFDWRVWDVDSLPSTLTTSLRVGFYTSYGFELYACSASSGWNTTQCSFTQGVDIPLAIRTDFARNGNISIGSFQTVTTACPDFATLKNALGLVDRHCEAHFKFAFAPTLFASSTPYVSITFTAIDDDSAESSSISTLIAVKALNKPPTVWAPAVILAGQGVSDPFLRDTSSDSPTFDKPVTVDDVDSNGNIELLVIEVAAGYSGNLIWPHSAPCTVDSSNSMKWNCYDRIASFAQWLPDIRFSVTSGERADIIFTMCDLGHTSDYKPSASLNVSTTTSIRITAAVAAPTGNSSTLAIALGVAAAVGLLLLGALGFFLRRRANPPDDEYFSAATTPITAAAESPLYQPQNQEHISAIYKAK